MTVNNTNTIYVHHSLTNYYAHFKAKQLYNDKDECIKQLPELRVN